jgi:uncharacterized PurR-regulated membrane protein YhhQ (DUF165 family)
VSDGSIISDLVQAIADLYKETYGEATALLVLCVVWIPAQAMTALCRYSPREALEVNNFAEFLAVDVASICDMIS